jgi:stage IV sporulation protein FB
MSIPIRIHPLFWALAALIGWLSTFNITLTIIWMVIILFSVLVHEFGHALTAVYFGQKAVINLMAFGGVTQRTGDKLKLWQEFVIVLNGPLFGFILCVGAYALHQTIEDDYGHLTAYALYVTAAVNLFWTFVNLLPVQPLDGGRLLRIVLEGIFGFKGVKFATLLSVGLCAVIGLAFFAAGFMIGGAIFFLLTFENYRAWKSMSVMTEQDQDVSLWQQLNVAEAAFKIGNYDQAWTILQQLKRHVNDGVLKNSASQMMSSILFAKEQYDEAYTQISPIVKKLTPDFMQMAQQIAYKSGHFDEAVDFGNRAYQEDPTYEIALTNAYCFAKKGDATPAIGWLRRAQNDGVPNFLNILKEDVFDAVRYNPEFQLLQGDLSD